MEEPFQEGKGRKPRKRRPSVASLEHQAVEPGPSHRPPSAEVPKKAKKSNPQAPQANPNRPAPAKQVAQNKPPAENKIPPIIIRDAAKWASVSSAMTTRQIKFSKAKTCIDGIRVNTVTIDDFRALTRLLEERKVPYHSFALPEQNTLRAVLRTVPCEILIDDVRADLEEQGLAPPGRKKLCPWSLSRSPRTRARSLNSKPCATCRPRSSGPTKRGRFHHSQRHALPKCVKCGESHDTHSCEKTNEDAAKCANCGGAHTASYRGCPRFPRGPQAKKSSGSAAPKPQQKPAAAPAKQSATPAAPVRPQNRPRDQNRDQRQRVEKLRGRSLDKKDPPRLLLRENDINEILDSGTSVIAAGDFNAKHEAWGSRRANRNGRILIEHADNIDIIIEARDFHADTLDIALLKNVPFQTRLHASQALDSDHLPVLMHIGDEASDANRNATVQITNWSRFAEILETDFGPVPRIESVADLESAAGAFEEKIKTAMSDSTRTRVEPPEKENLPQWIVDLIRAKNLARRQAYRTGSAVDRTEANRLGNEVKFALIDHRSVGKKTQIPHR
jgi:hypothetical protein